MARLADHRHVTGLSQNPSLSPGTVSIASTLSPRNRAFFGMDEKIDYYRRQAARCRDWAETSSNPDIRAEYERLVGAWLALANFRHQANPPVGPVTNTPADTAVSKKSMAR